jgi:phage-related protein
VASEVGSGQVSIFPVFKGFRKAVNAEVDGSTADASTRFQRGFRSTGQSSGTAVGRGFRDTFTAQTRNVANVAVKQITDQVAVATRSLSAARLKEQDAAGKLRLAETQLTEAQAKYAAGSSQVVRAEERAASAHRALEAVQTTVKTSTEALSSAQTRLAEASTRAAQTTGSAGRGLRSAFAGIGPAIAGVADAAASGFSNAMGRIRSAASGAVDSVRSTTRLIGGIVASAVIYRGLAAATTAAKSAIFDFNSTLQNSTIAFTSLLGSGKKAQTFLDQLQQFAKSTPFEFTDLVKNSQLLLGMGISAKNVDPVPHRPRRLGRVRRRRHRRAQQHDPRVLADQCQGHPVDGQHEPAARGRRPVGAEGPRRAVPCDHRRDGQDDLDRQGPVVVALPLLIKGLEQGTSATAALGGMMDKQSATFTGALSNIKDGVSQLLAGAFRPFFDETTKGLVAFAGYLSSPAAQKWADAVAVAVAKAVSKIGTVKKAASDFIDGFLHGIDSLGSNQSSFAAWGATAYGALATIGRAASSVFQILAPLGPAVTKLLADLGPSLAKVAPQLGQALLALLPSVEQLIVALLPLIPQVASLIVTLVPAVQALVNVLIPLIQYGIIPIVQGLLDLTQPLAQFNSGVSTATIASEGLSGAFGPIFQALVQFGQQLGLVIQAIVAFATGVVAGVQQVDAAVTAVITNIIAFVAGVITAVTGFVTGLAAGIAAGFAQVVAVVTTAITAVQTTIRNVLQLILGLWLLAWDAISAVLAPIWARITGIVSGALAVVSGAITATLTTVQGVWNAVWGAIAGFLAPIWARITGIVSGAIGTVRGVVATGVAAVQGVWNAVWNAIVGFIGGVWGRIFGAVSGGIGRAHSAVSGGLSAISGVWNGAWNAIAGFLGGIWSRISSAVSSGIGRVVGLASGIGGRVLSAIGNVGSTLYNSGRALIQGFIDGIASMIGAVADIASAAMARAAQFFPHSPAKEGPFSGSGWTLYSGQALVEGFAQGVTKGKPTVAAAISDALGSVNASGNVMIGVQQQADALAGALSTHAVFRQTVLNYNAAPNQSFDEEKDLLDFMRRKTVVLGNA